jgi:hypothetical protein
MRLRPRATDCDGRKIEVGDQVRVARSLRSLNAHPEFRRAFRQVAGRITIVVGWDATGGAWIPFQAREVLTVEPHLLRVIRRGLHKLRRRGVGA